MYEFGRGEGQMDVGRMRYDQGMYVLEAVWEGGLGIEYWQCGNWDDLAVTRIGRHAVAEEGTGGVA